MTSIADKLQKVAGRIRLACAAAQRDPHEVTLLAVSKTFGPAAVAEAAAAGQRSFGENYIQEGVDKRRQVAALGLPTACALEWHCIGPIQGNKTRLVAENFDWAQTIDRLKIAQRLSAQRPAGLLPLNVCLQVNIEGAPTKSGVAPGEALALAQAVAALPGLRLRGIMHIPEPADGFDAQVAAHRRARALFDQLRAAGLPLDTLSMGMSEDLEAAIAAGSTMVRVGSAIFGGRAYPASAPPV
jgi:pyridoxal phosphate enzyme (YggS family)